MWLALGIVGLSTIGCEHHAPANSEAGSASTSPVDPAATGSITEAPVKA